MEKWQWGNFDKTRQYIDRAYLPSLQTMRVTFIRLARQLLQEGKKDKAIALTDKYFEVFPKMNFPYDQFSAFMAAIYGQAGAKEKAASKMREIADAMEQQLRFFKSQSPDFQKGYKSDYNYAMGTVQTILRLADDMKDDALTKELDERFSPYMQSAPPPPGLKKN